MNGLMRAVHGGKACLRGSSWCRPGCEVAESFVRAGILTRQRRKGLCPTAGRVARRGADECCVTDAGGAREDLVSDRFGLGAEVDTYWLAVGARFLCLLSLRRAKKVSAAPHRGNANRPIRMQGKATAARPKPNRPTRKQGKTNAARPKPIDRQENKERPTQQGTR
jgi:hypothetical protein